MDKCAICKNTITEACIECEAKQSSNMNLDCPIAWGVCNHAYHHHCIIRWTNTH